MLGGTNRLFGILVMDIKRAGLFLFKKKRSPAHVFYEKNDLQFLIFSNKA
jgi:hypothetical protein